MRSLFILIVLLCAADAAAQERMSPAAGDSSRIVLRGTPEFLGRPVTILPLTFALNVPQTNTTLPLYQSFAGVPQSFSWEQQQTVDLTAPLKLQLYQSETEKAIRITLGAAQLGGAAFLAYKYLKRNGFK